MLLYTKPFLLPIDTQHIQSVPVLILHPTEIQPLSEVTKLLAHGSIVDPVA